MNLFINSWRIIIIALCLCFPLFREAHGQNGESAMRAPRELVKNSFEFWNLSDKSREYIRRIPFDVHLSRFLNLNPDLCVPLPCTLRFSRKVSIIEMESHFFLDPAFYTEAAYYVAGAIWNSNNQVLLITLTTNLDEGTPERIFGTFFDLEGNYLYSKLINHDLPGLGSPEKRYVKVDSFSIEILPEKGTVFYSKDTLGNFDLGY